MLFHCILVFYTNLIEQRFKQLFIFEINIKGRLHINDVNVTRHFIFMTRLQYNQQARYANSTSYSDDVCQLQVHLILSHLLLLAAVTYTNAACPRHPAGRAAHRTPGDGGFKISISGEPDKYVPNSVYTGLYPLT